ncbi:flagellar motor switch protein FliM [Georgenia sp. AZ-5]|uniref:flagellar motor switch protein FliM n=1 Tax=Georgenia sp. AZ-5 TaxID=3367526 RepID=UPI003754C4CC
MTVQTQKSSFGVPARRTIEVYDFRRPTTLVREHSRVLELAFETFARQWGTQLTAKVRVVAQVTLNQVAMATYDEYVASLPPATAMVLCTIEDMAPRAVVQVPSSTALSWVGHMLGGTGTVASPDRKFTPVEQALVGNLMSETLEDLRYSLGGLLTAALKVQSIQHNSQFAQAAATGELMIVATFDLRVGERASTGTVAIPADAILPQLGEANPAEPAANAKNLVAAQVAQTPVDVAVRLAPARMRPAEVLALSVGDLLHLPHPESRPLEVAVEGRTLAHAAVGANGSRLACVIVDTEENPR